MHVNGDGLRVVDKDTKALILDQSIEKVSFCAAYRHQKHEFSYICRDGTTKRWMCHGFLATKDPGERLSQAVGYAFAVCLERKNRYDTECRVRMTFDKQNSAFTRIGSFRQKTLTERLHNERGIDIAKVAPSAIVTPQPKAQPIIPHNPHAIERPHASPLMLERQGSCRALSSLNSQSPFKRRMSLRLSDLPSNVDRQRLFCERLTNSQAIHFVSASPGEMLQPSQLQSSQLQPECTMNQRPEIDVIDTLCKELNHISEVIIRNDAHSNAFNDDGTELNFNLQTFSMSTSSTTAPNSVSSTNTAPSTISVDVIPKKVAVRPIEIVSPSVLVNPFVSDDHVSIDDESTNHNGVTSAPYAIVASQSDRHPPAILQHFPTSNEGCDLSTTKAVVTAIVPPNNTLLETTDDLLDRFVENTTPEPSQVDNLQSDPLNNDPFDAEWVARVANMIQETNELPATSQLPIIINTNPFVSPVVVNGSQL